MTDREEAIGNIFDELKKAEKKHPCWPDDPFEQLAVIGEEYGELQQAVLQAKYENGDPEKIKVEGLHLAAMVMRFLFNLK